MADFTKAQLQKAFEVEQERRSLEFFEPRRADIARACSERLGIPEHEFVLGQGTEFFHFLTLLLAVGEWVAATGFEAMWKRQEEDHHAFDEYPRMKLVSEAIARLLLHPLGVDISGEQQLQFLNAFMQSSTPEGMDGPSQMRRARMVQAVLMAYLIGRRGMIQTIQGYWGTGSPGGLKDYDYDQLQAFLDENDSDEDRCEIFPREAEKDAFCSLYYEASFLLERNGRLPGPMPTSPESVGEDRAFDLLKRYMIQFSLFRKSVALTGAKLAASKKTFADAAQALGGEKPFALFASASDEGGEQGKTLPAFLHREGAGAHLMGVLAKGAKDAGLNVSIVSLPML